VAGYDDYYPYGLQMSGRSLVASEDGRYKFTGKELDSDEGLYYFGARYYDSWNARWLQVDPLAAKYSEYSPYNYTLNNPLRLIDLNGKGPGDAGHYSAEFGGWLYDDITSTADRYYDKSFYQSNNIYISSVNNQKNVIDISNDNGQQDNITSSDIKDSPTKAGLVIGSLGSARGVTNDLFKYAKQIGGEIKAGEGAAKYLTISKGVAEGAAGLSVLIAGYQLYKSEGKGSDYARAIASLGIAASGFIPGFGPIISIGLGIEDANGYFNNIYNYFDK